MFNRLVQVVRGWLGQTSKPYASDVTLLKPRGNEITFAIRVKARRNGDNVSLGEVEQDFEFGPKWINADEDQLWEVAHKAGVYAMTIALVGRIHQMEDYHGIRIYSTILKAMNDYYFDTESLPENE
jgi:hypothetical protein